MLLREVREDERVEADAVEPPVVRAVRRRLERDRVVAGVEHLAEEPLQVDRLGRRVRRGARHAADDPFDRADQPRSCRPSASRIERRRNVVVVLPFVPVTPATASRSVGAPKKASARDGHRRAHGLDDELRHGELERALDDERGGTGRDGLGREVVPVARATRARRRRACPSPTRRVS